MFLVLLALAALAAGIASAIAGAGIGSRVVSGIILIIGTLLFWQSTLAA